MASIPNDEDDLIRWTSEHYLDPVLYEHEYRRHRADVGFYRTCARQRRGDVLELGVGSGRVMVPLLRDGHRVVGLDRSQEMLHHLKQRLGRLPGAARHRGLLIRADFRRFMLGRRFPLIFCPFNAMMHLYSRDDVARFLACVREHLLPDGRFVFDVLNPDLQWLMRDPHRRWSRTRFKDPRTGRAYHYTTNHVYDAASQIAWIRIYYDTVAPGDRDATAGAGSRVVHLAHRQFFPEELLALLDHSGFRVERREGGFHGEPFTGDAPSQVCTCSMRY